MALAIVAIASMICIDSDDSSAVKHDGATFEVDGIKYSYTQDDLYGPYTTKIGDGANPVITSDVESFVIPDSVEYDGEVYEITRIGIDAFKNCTNLKSVMIPSSIEVIGRNAFWGCTGLTEFTIPATVKEIGSCAFVLCSNLEELTISEGVETIGQGAFQECVKLTSITIPSTVSTIETDAFAKCDLLESVVISPGVTAISGHMFSSCRALSSVSIPSTVESIGSRAFSSCRALESITIPEGVVTIGSYAFQYCTALESIVLPSTANSLSYLMLGGCTALETVEVLGNPTLVSEECFASCTSLRTVNIPDSVETIGKKAFWGCSSLQSIVIPEGVTMIGESAFEGCSSMRTAEIPSTIVEFTGRAFYGCSSLQSISIPTGTTTLGDYAFWGCTSLIEVSVPGSVTVPGDYLFSRCTGLRSAVLSEGVSCVSKSMFEGCTSLRIVTFAATVDTIRGDAFYGCSSLSRRTAGDVQIGEPTINGAFKIPDSVETIGNRAFYGCSSIKHLRISGGVTTVYGQAFSNCTSLIEVLVPSTITNLDSTSMFSGCTALERVEIEEGVSTVGKSMFKRCTSLEAVKLPQSITTIDDDAFYGCTSLISVSIREGVETIGERAFYDCISLMDMRIPDSVTTIENKAFEHVCMPGGAIPAAGVTVGHQYVSAYDFNNDFSNCDITLTCENDPDHVVSRTVIPVIDNEANEATARLKHGVRIYSKTVPLEIVLPAPTADDRSYVYSGEEQTFVLEGFDPGLMTMVNGKHTDAGTYTVTVSIKEDSNAEWASGVLEDPTFTFTIERKPITESIISVGGLVYAGTSQDAAVVVDDGRAHPIDDYTISGTSSAVDAGSYTLTVTASGNGNYSGSADKTWSIGKRALTIRPADVNVPVGTAAPEYSATGVGFAEGEDMEDLDGTPGFACGYTSGSAVGATHPIAVTGYESQNYTIQYDTGTLTVVKARLTRPQAIDYKFVFDGGEQTYVPIGFDSRTMLISGNIRIDAGTQDVTVSIMSPETYNWDDDTGTDIVFQFDIGPKTITSDMISPCEFVFDDSPHTAEVTVDGGKAHPASDYTLKGVTTATGVGVYTLTVEAEKGGNYVGSADKAWSIVRSQPIETGSGYMCESEDGGAFIGGESMSRIVEDANGDDDVTLSVTGDGATVTFDSDAIKALGGDPVTLTMDKLDKEGAGEAWEVIGDDSSIYRISLSKTVEFGGGGVEISIPYQLADGEDPKGLKILRVVDGVVVEEISCKYENGKVTFHTDHLSSMYGVRYVEPEEEGSGLPVAAMAIGVVAALVLVGAVAIIMKRRSSRRD